MAVPRKALSRAQRRNCDDLLGQTNRIRKLQGYLNIHVGIINILLAEHGLEMLNLELERAEARHCGLDKG